MYAISRGTIYCKPHQNSENTPHQEIQDVCHTRKYHTYLKNNLYATSVETMCCMPHQDIQDICHIKKYRMYATSGNIHVWWKIYSLHQKRQRYNKKYYICMKNNMCATSTYMLYARSGNTRSVPQQATGVVRHILDYYIHVCGVCGVCGDIHDDVIKWKHFPRYWPFVRGIHRSPVNSPHKASDAELWCFLWSASQ